MMYPSVRTSIEIEETPDAEHLPSRIRAVPANVLFIGLTSMFTDVSSEMVNAILPLYLISQLRFSYLQFGFFNGIYLGMTGLITIAGAVIADRWRRYKEVAGAGYALSAACKMGLYATRTAPVAATTVLFTDRVGKGVRTSPRDALISLSAEPRRHGIAFGVHRALDTAGAVAGPVVAYLILRNAPHAYDAVIVVSFLIALIALAVLVLFVQNRRDGHQPHRGASWRAVFALLRRPDFRALTVIGTLLGLFTVADAFVYLTLANQPNFDDVYFPLLATGMALSYLVLAIPFGHGADRVGRSRVFLAGYVLLLGVYAFLMLPSLGGLGIVMVLLLLGAFYACTDGVLAAMTSAAVPAEHRTSGLAVLTTATSVSFFVSSILFPQLVDWWGTTAALRAFAVALAAVIMLGAAVLRVRTRRYG